MIVVYIAGPFRGPDAWAIESNIREAETIGLEVARAGAIPFIPHTMYRYFQGAAPDAFWLEADLELLRRCDALLLTPRWESSAGARAERRLAEEWGMPAAVYQPGGDMRRTLLELEAGVSGSVVRMGER